MKIIIEKGDKIKTNYRFCQSTINEIANKLEELNQRVQKIEKLLERMNNEEVEEGIEIDEDKEN